MRRGLTVREPTPPEPAGAAERLVLALGAYGLTLASGESLTAGLVTDAIVAIPGSSAVLRGGITAYQVPAKVSVLGVPAEMIDDPGVVSEPVALAMARGAARVLSAELGIGTTGVAGPGASDGVAAGTVCLAAVLRWEGQVHEIARTWQLAGVRRAVRSASAQLALALALELVVTAPTAAGGQHLG